MVESKGLVLVTGVSGFVGSAVARAFVDAGYAVRGMARGGSDRTNLADFPGEVVTGDMMDKASVVAALRGTDYLAHVAADYRLWARDPEEIVRHNRFGTKTVMDAALTAGTRRIVYTSSVATIKPMKVAPADEERPLPEDQAIGAYKRSKVVAERLVERMVGEQGLPAIIVNPSTPIGPRDVKPTPTGRMLIEAAKGKLPAFVDTGLNFVHVDDVARGHVLALERGLAGRRYILGGDDVTLGAFLAEVARQVGRKPPRVKLPILPLIPLAFGAERVARITGREPMLTRDALKMARRHMFFSSARAKAELGYASRPWSEGVTDALAWFRSAGMLG
ncbi:hopanoid-associated sugar epimerase [Sphingomonas nostoxanthinifaciens]|uniref:hopanoid-associated sugar epimerase n=1 Tax=Sphingomonas nostoxanthinifaciens TaxID=2872652 RepID=UPI001CC1C4F5|nr:hopanoid-associated sugar epimerase [Sphingomonas nostoxanthinifaciens]UAK23501.1 NAD-dependent epimerase/dehydratase family protein [Sphingomonas nostoxanthinifaciens]